MPQTQARLSNLGYASMALTSVSASLVSSVSPLAALVTQTTISVESAAVRYRDDGTAPTTTVGTPLAAATQLTYNGDIRAMQIIASAGAATAHFNFYGR